ncbi:unnamed protein product, partial [Didymodactylos carnosus]
MRKCQRKILSRLDGGRGGDEVESLRSDPREVDLSKLSMIQGDDEAGSLRGDARERAKDNPLSTSAAYLKFYSLDKIVKYLRNDVILVYSIMLQWIFKNLLPTGIRSRPYLDSCTIDEVQQMCRTVENNVDLSCLQQKLLRLFQTLYELEQMPDMNYYEFKSKLLLNDQFGFYLEKRRSKSPLINGDGTFLTGGSVTCGQLVAIYPGTIYRRYRDPLFFQSIKNRFLLSRKDQIVLDGNDRGLSKSIFLSCYARDGSLYGDATWLLWNKLNRRTKKYPYIRNPLTLGHYINHFPKNSLPNVTYFEFDFEFLQNYPQLYRYAPHVYYNSNEIENILCMPSTVLISLRNIEENEELYSCYMNIPQSVHMEYRNCTLYKQLDEKSKSSFILTQQLLVDIILSFKPI